MEDAVLILKLLSKLPPVSTLLPSADTDGDQRLDLNDAVFILRLITEEAQP
jgi:hypothetical protein